MRSILHRSWPLLVAMLAAWAVHAIEPASPLWDSLSIAVTFAAGLWLGQARGQLRQLRADTRKAGQVIELLEEEGWLQRYERASRN